MKKNIYDSFSFLVGGWELGLEKTHKTGIFLFDFFKTYQAVEQVGKKKDTDFANNFGAVITDITKPRMSKEVYFSFHTQTY